jgi:hypothetical protein
MHRLIVAIAWISRLEGSGVGDQTTTRVIGYVPTASRTDLSSLGDHAVVNLEKSSLPCNWKPKCNSMASSLDRKLHSLHRDRVRGSEISPNWCDHASGRPAEHSLRMSTIPENLSGLRLLLRQSIYAL